MNKHRKTLAGLACIVAAALVSGCQHQKQPPVNRSATTAYNTSELPIKANRTQTRSFGNARIVQTGMDDAPTFVPNTPSAVGAVRE